jgi:hypothetical protein
VVKVNPLVAAGALACLAALGLADFVAGLVAMRFGTAAFLEAGFAALFLALFDMVRLLCVNGNSRYSTAPQMRGRCFLAQVEACAVSA